MTASRQGCLAGLRVVDLSTGPAGFQATQHLADNGADVLYFESPTANGWRRHPSWPMWTRGKRTEVADLRDPATIARIRDVILGADVLIETFRPGVAAKLGLEAASLQADSPGLIHGSVTAFGTTGRYANVAGYEGIVMAALGIMRAYSVTQRKERPVFGPAWMCTASAAQLLLQGVLAAIIERQRSGTGQIVETSLVDAIASQDLNNLTHLVLARRFPDAFNAVPFVSPDGIPNSGMAFRSLVALTRDGRWLQFGQLSERLFKAMMRALGLEWMFDDPTWLTAPEFEDPSTRVQFWEHLLSAARQKTLAEWQEVFESDPDVWAELYRRGDELLHHPQLIADDRVVTMGAADGGVLRMPGLLVHLDASPGVAPRAAREVVNEGFRSPRWPLPPTSPRRQDEGPLSGVTILELGMYFAGPLGATMLADLGARVIKVEAFEGDPGRNFTGFPEAGGTRTTQGKQSIAIDMSTSEGVELVRELARRSDVVLQSFRSGVAERLGIDAVELMRCNPQLVYVDAPGYGTRGPCAAKPSFAPTIGAASGFALRNLGPTVPEAAELSLDDVKFHASRLFPATILVGHADAFAAHAVASAILLGLIARDRSGEGQRLETSMLATMAHVLSDQMVEGSSIPQWPGPDEEMLGTSPLYRLYKCSAGWVFLAAVKPREVAALWAVIGSFAGRAEPDTSNSARSDAVDVALLEEFFGSKSASEVESALIHAGVPCVVVAEVTPAEVLLDNLLEREGGFTRMAPHPLWDEYPRLEPALRFSRSVTYAPGGCLCGQHSDLILMELGRSADEINQLRARRIVQ